jgi:hypothetical protein
MISIYRYDPSASFVCHPSAIRVSIPLNLTRDYYSVLLQYLQCFIDSNKPTHIVLAITGNVSDGGITFLHSSEPPPDPSTSIFQTPSISDAARFVFDQLTIFLTHSE